MINVENSESDLLHSLVRYRIRCLSYVNCSLGKGSCDITVTYFHTNRAGSK